MYRYLIPFACQKTYGIGGEKGGPITVAHFGYLPIMSKKIIHIFYIITHCKISCYHLIRNPVGKKTNLHIAVFLFMRIKRKKKQDF